MGYSRAQMITLGVIFMILPIIAVILRLWSKALRRAHLGTDDYLIFPALVFTVAACVTQIIAAVLGELGQHASSPPQGEFITTHPYIVYEQCKFALQLIAYLSSGFTKASIVVFYARIFSTRSFHIATAIMLAIVVTWAVSFFFASLFQCHPISTIWTIVEPAYGNRCIHSVPFYYAASSTGIITDFLILAMPVPMVWRLQLPVRQKLAVIGMFLLGALTCAASVVRLVVFLQVGDAMVLHSNDITYWTSPVFMWTVIELSLAVVSACLPTLRPLFVQYRPGRSTFSRSNRSPPHSSLFSRFAGRRSHTGYLRNAHGELSGKDGASDKTKSDDFAPSEAGFDLQGLGRGQVSTHIEGSTHQVDLHQREEELNANPSCNQQCQIDRGLGPRLSKGASIVHSSSAAPRWSEFGAPDPGTVVNVATEEDVLVTVQYCNQNNLEFLAQNGGHAWSTTFHLGQQGVLLNLRGLNQVKFNGKRTEVTFQGGALISEVIAAAYANDAQVPTGNCNCVGTLGAILGGGFGRLMGLYGLGIDNLLSVNLVTPSGVAIKVDPSNADLWWALRGAGPNFGIVTSATMKSYPVLRALNGAWTGSLVFTESQIPALVQAINDLSLSPAMAIFLYFATTGAPDDTPAVIALPFYVGSATDGRATFASIYAVGPVADATAFTPYDQLNKGGDVFCVKGQRKPSFGAGLARMDPATWQAVWDEYRAFLKNPGTGNSAVLAECYSMDKARELPDNSSSYPFRSTVRCNAVVNTWYADPSLDGVAEAFGAKVRDLWRATAGLAANSTYINFAFGDESLATVYGDNLARLQALKKEYDPKGRFDQFFPLSQ